MKRAFFLVGLALMVVGCGGGGDGDAGTGSTMQPAFPEGGVREADGTVAYCGDFALPEWPPLRFENNVWGKLDITDYEQCILAREGAMGIEHGWRWRWPLGAEFGYQYQVKGYPEVHYGQKPFFDLPSSVPTMPVRISDIREMTVRYAVDMTAEGQYNLAFDMLLSPTNPPTTVTHEIMVWVDRSEGFIAQPEEYFVEEVTIGGVTYDFYRRDNFDPYLTTRPPDEIPEHIISIQQFVGPEGRFSGSLDMAAFYDYLVDEGHVDPSYYVTVIEFGNEVIEGTGETWLREYEVTVRSASP